MTAVEWNDLADAANNTIVSLSTSSSFSWNWLSSNPLAIAADWVWSSHLNNSASYQMAWLVVNWTVNANSFIYTSDRRLKQNIETIKWWLSSVLSLRWVKFDWKDNGTSDIWLIAQEVEQILPDTVVELESTKKKAVKYGNLVAVLIEAIKDLSIKNKIQEKLIDDLELRINKLENTK